MFGEKGLTDLEQTVLSGNWTLSKMQEYSRHWTDDAVANTDGAATNVYGLGISQKNMVDAFYHAAGFKGIDTNELGMPEHVFLKESVLNEIDPFFTALVTLCDSSEVYINPSFQPEDGMAPLQNGTAAMFVAEMGRIGLVSGSKDHIFIPMPKLLPSQEYRTVFNWSHDVWSVPIHSENPEIGGLIIELLASTDYLSIAPLWYGYNLAGRYSTDDVGGQIFNLVRQSSTAEFARLYVTAGTPYSILRNALVNSRSEIVLANNVKYELSQANTSLRISLNNFKNAMPYQ